MTFPIIRRPVFKVAAADLENRLLFSSHLSKSVAFQQVAAPKLAAREALAVREVAATQPVAQS